MSIVNIGYSVNDEPPSHIPHSLWESLSSDELRETYAKNGYGKGKFVKGQGITSMEDIRPSSDNDSNVE